MLYSTSLELIAPNYNRKQWIPLFGECKGYKDEETEETGVFLAASKENTGNNSQSSTFSGQRKQGTFIEENHTYSY
jgi:hypothetical protein